MLRTTSSNSVNCCLSTDFYQAKEIVKNYKDKLGYETPEKFASMDEVDISSMGRFVSELDDKDLEQLNESASAEAVRQIGRVPLDVLPREIRKNKAQTVLRMLVSRTKGGPVVTRLYKIIIIVRSM